MESDRDDGKPGPPRWVLRLTRGKRRNRGLGPYLLVTIDKAREQATNIKRAARDGRDLIRELEQQRASRHLPSGVRGLLREPEKDAIEQQASAAVELDDRDLRLSEDRRRKQYSQALPLLRECVSRTPNLRAAHCWLGATYAQLGSIEKARAEAAEVLRIDPKWTIEGAGAQLSRFKRAEDAEHYFGGLRKAGLPER